MTWQKLSNWANFLILHHDIFVDRLIKMRHLIFIVIMKIKKTTQTFYVYVWKHHDLLEFFVFDRDIQFIFDVWRHFCQMLRIDVKYFIAYHLEINEQTVMMLFERVISRWVDIYMREICSASRVSLAIVVSLW